MSLREKIYEAGVVGAGGAGFPTHIKYSGDAEHLIINAAECEPLLFTDQYQMQTKAKEIIGGIKLGQEYLKCEKTTVAIKGEFTEIKESFSSFKKPSIFSISTTEAYSA